MNTQTYPRMNWRTRIGGREFKIMRLNDAPAADEVVDTPERVVAYLQPKLAESVIYRPDVENLIIVHLNTRRRAIGFEIISSGTLDMLLVHPRDVFKSAFVMNSAAFVVVHNHPSGDPGPSDADIKVTRDLIRAGDMLKLPVLDHIILGKFAPACSKGFCSLRELGYFS